MYKNNDNLVPFERFYVQTRMRASLLERCPQREFHEHMRELFNVEQRLVIADKVFRDFREHHFASLVELCKDVRRRFPYQYIPYRATSNPVTLLQFLNSRTKENVMSVETDKLFFVLCLPARDQSIVQVMDEAYCWQNGGKTLMRSHIVYSLGERSWNSSV